ncbi:MAG: SDR family oxidoreductase [Proteobacteria bacterium]|nr:SDR family oxidoreductase [Pseudomonadota bacterium]
MDRNREFAGKVAFISGAGSGIGLATAELLASLGARVAIGDISTDAADRAAAKIAAMGGTALPLTVDVGDHAALARAVSRIEADFGGLDLAVNNAAIPGPRVPLEDYPIEAWKAVIDIDLTAVFYALRTELPAMKRRGGGSIVNIASIAGGLGIPLTGPYAAAKHGVVGLTRVAALENATANIRINAVGPGYVETPFVMERGEDIVRAYREKHPVKRMATTAEIAEQVAFLLSDRASFVTGAYHIIDGGYSAQ